MSKSLCHAGVAACANFASPGLRRACIAHRATVLKGHLGRGHRKLQPGSRRGYVASVSNDTPKSLEDDSFKEFSTGPRETELAGPAKSKGVQIHRSISKLDPYLPLELRSGTWLQNLSKFEGVRDPLTLPEVLLSVNKHFPNGVLASIALEQGRWSSFLYLAEALIKSSNVFQAPYDNSIPNGSIWAHQDATFPSIFNIDGTIELRIPENDSERDWNPLHAATSKDLAAADELVKVKRRDAMGLLWDALGRITLDATDCERETYEYMMSFVHRVLSIMHREGQMHPAIYQFDSDQIPKAYRKPPFLHLMSSRIMTVISDSTWKANENQIIDNYTWMGAAYASSGGLDLKDLYPSVRAIGSETWLDLILWSCVHGGHISAGASILREIARRNTKDQWTSISWDVLLKANLEENNAVDAKKLEDRLKRVAGGHEGYSRDEPIVSFPEKTISSEVVAALLGNMAATTKLGVASKYAFNAAKLKHMISRSGIFTNRNFWNLIAAHFINFGNMDPNSKPAFLGIVSDVISIQTSCSGKREKSHSNSQENVEHSDVTSALGPVYQHAFASLVDAGDVNRALRAFSKLQGWLDGRKRRAIDMFFSMKSSRFYEEFGQDGTELDDKSFLQEFSMPIPVPTLAKFLDLLTKHELFDLGIWLLSSNDADGPIISPEVRNSVAFQPALLRLAVAIGDTELVHEIAERMQKMEFLSLGLLHPLIQAQIQMHKFRQAESVLHFVSNQDLGTASVEDVMILARQVLILERKTDKVSRNDLEQAGSLLNAILLKQYIPRRSPHLPIDLRTYHELNQLSRIFSSIDGEIKRYAGTGIFEPGRYGGGARIPADSFDIILGAVVQTRGPHEGKKLFDQWCVSTYDDSRQAPYHADIDDLVIVQNDYPNDEPVVLPTKRTILTILMPFVDHVKEAVNKDIASLPYSASSFPPIEDFREKSVERSKPFLAFELETVEDELESEDNSLQSTSNVQLRSDINLDDRDVSLIQWGVDCLTQMGMTDGEITAELPDLLESEAKPNANEHEDIDTHS